MDSSTDSVELMVLPVMERFLTQALHNMAALFGMIVMAIMVFKHL